jgi:hypothetical protein
MQASNLSRERNGWGAQGHVTDIQSALYGAAAGAIQAVLEKLSGGDIPLITDERLVFDGYQEIRR